MTDVPVQQSGAAPEQIEDPNATAEQIAADPTRSGSPEWLAAKQRLVEQRKDQNGEFSELEKELQGLKGMSEV